MSSSQGVRFMGKAPNGTAKAINVTGEGSLVVCLAGSGLDLRGKFADRPTSPGVAGTTYWAVDKNDENELTKWTGTMWEPL